MRQTDSALSGTVYVLMLTAEGQNRRKITEAGLEKVPTLLLF